MSDIPDDPADAPKLPAVVDPVRAVRATTEPDDPLDDRSWAEVLRALVDQAKAGSVHAGEVLRRHRRSVRRPVRIDLPPIVGAADAARAQAHLLAETCAGRLDPRDGAALSRMVENRRLAIETLELETDLRALNAANLENERNRRGGRR